MSEANRNQDERFVSQSRSNRSSELFGRTAPQPPGLWGVLFSVFILAIWLVCMVMVFAAVSGCSYNAPKKHKLDLRLQEESRELTTAIVDTLTDSTNRDSHTRLARKLAVQDQRIEGLPVRPLKIELLLLGDKEAEESLREKFDHENELIGRMRRHEQNLLDLGAVTEEKKNKSILKRFWAWATGLTGLLTIVGIVLFCPALIPVLGRMLGWIVSKLPSLASAIGVVSVKAFDGVVRGVEKAKEAYTDKHDDSKEDLETLNVNLSREMDADHKALVRARKAKVIA